MAARQRAIADKRGGGQLKIHGGKVVG